MKAKVVSQQDINEVLHQCAEQIDNGGSKFPDMTYEEGIEAALYWLQDGGESPLKSLTKTEKLIVNEEQACIFTRTV